MFSKSSDILITPGALLTLLSQIQELNGYDLSLNEKNGKIEVQVGTSTYTLEPESELEVSQEVIDTVQDVNEIGYDEFEELIQEEPVSGGIIKELVKTLALGGLVRLTKHALEHA